MAEHVGTKSRVWVAGLAGAALVAALVFSLREAPPQAPAPETQTPPPAAVHQIPPMSGVAPSPPAPGMTSSALPEALKLPEPGEDTSPKPYPLDLVALQARLPDNLYWKLAAPSTDAEVLRRREEETKRWSEVFGRVQSGEATEEEVRQYYERRRKVSEDMLQFATTVLAEHGDALPERDKGLYELSINMHRTRLSEYPRQEADAQAHRLTRAQQRQAWRQGQSQQP
ncbi:hypothetical protein [Myxococcus landrumensis]|uniref:Lipase chaperone n=1 Tax=Myxococcus landrumensis TaxID=2813577 RepID=A0ABX7N8D0_9BACT|nr:hypothetical protein [Myxococcus landrumus]QSQ13804.1 hypothetical protein JY572_36675 [Myxococcus landrumus]